MVPPPPSFAFSFSAPSALFSLLLLCSMMAATSQSSPRTKLKLTSDAPVVLDAPVTFEAKLENLHAWEEGHVLVFRWSKSKVKLLLASIHFFRH